MRSPKAERLLNGQYAPVMRCYVSIKVQLAISALTDRVDEKKEEAFLFSNLYNYDDGPLRNGKAGRAVLFYGSVASAGSFRIDCFCRFIYFSDC